MSRCNLYLLHLSTLLVIGTLAANAAEKPAPATPPAKAAARTSAQPFDDIFKRLDTGGDLLVVASLDGCLEKLMKDIEQAVGAMSTSATPSPELEKVRSTIQKVGAFLNKQGLYALDGFGLSAVPRADGLNDIKSFVARDPAAASLPIWKGFVGMKPRRLASIDFVPQSAVMAGAGMTDPGIVWSIIRDAVREIAPPEASASLDTWLANTTTSTGIDLDKVLKSTGDEVFFAVLSASPQAGAAAQPEAVNLSPIPFTFIAGAAVKDDTFATSLKQYFVQKNIKTAVSNFGDAEITAFAAPGALGMFIQPAVAFCKGYVVIGSNADVVRSAIASFNKKDGLVSTSEFKAAFAGLPMENNAITYVSPDFLQKIQQAQQNMSGGEGAEFQAAFNKILGLEHYSASYVLVNVRNGLLTTGRSSMSGRQITMQTALMPLGMVAGAALPALMFRSQMGAMQGGLQPVPASEGCRNNLRILDASKEQWAMESGATNGAAPDVTGVLRYVKDAAMPTCPQGGTYKLNEIGSDPTCSFPGHTLAGD